MNETLSHITLAPLALAAVVLAGVIRFGGQAWAWAVRAVHFVDKLESIEKQVHANGGSSLRDAVDQGREEVRQVVSTQAALALALEEQASETRELRVAFEQHVQDSARQARRADDPPDADFRSSAH